MCEGRVGPPEPWKSSPPLDMFTYTTERTQWLRDLCTFFVFVLRVAVISTETRPHPTQQGTLCLTVTGFYYYFILFYLSFSQFLVWPTKLFLPSNSREVWADTRALTKQTFGTLAIQNRLFIWGEGGKFASRKCDGSAVRAPPSAAHPRRRTLSVNNTREGGWGPGISGTFCYIPSIINGKALNCCAV